MGNKFYLRKIRVNAGGYDSSGRYWGVNRNNIGDVYQYSTDNFDFTRYIRVPCRDQAKAWIRSCYSGATFFR